MKWFCSNCIAIEISGSIWPDSIMRWELRVRDVTRIQLSYSRAAAQCRNRKINNGAAGRRSKPVIQFIFFSSSLALSLTDCVRLHSPWKRSAWCEPSCCNYGLIQIAWCCVWRDSSFGIQRLAQKPFEFVIQRFRFPPPRRFFSSLFFAAESAERLLSTLRQSKYLNYRNSRQLNNLVPTFPYKKVAWRLILSNVNNTCTWRRCHGNIYANEYLTRAPQRERWEHLSRRFCSISISTQHQLFAFWCRRVRRVL